MCEGLSMRRNAATLLIYNTHGTYVFPFVGDPWYYRLAKYYPSALTGDPGMQRFDMIEVDSSQIFREVYRWNRDYIVPYDNPVVPSKLVVVLNGVRQEIPMRRWPYQLAAYCAVLSYSLRKYRRRILGV